MEPVTFRNGGIDIAAIIHVPPNFDPARANPALVCVHPGSSVKEQTAGLYAARMATHGYVAIAFDASYQGESGGEPRFLEDPAARVEDIRCAVDFLATLPYVDENRIGVLGVCAGGGYAVNATMTEHRIKAVGTVVGVNIGRAYRAQDAVATLKAVGAQRSYEAKGEPPLLVNWLPDSPEERDAADITALDTYEAVDYYRTARGYCASASNRLLFRSIDRIMGFDAFNLVEQLLTQPIQIIVGDRIGEFGSYKEGQELFERVTSPKDLLVIEGASHYDLYDQPAFVDQAVERLVAFYAANL